MIEKRKFYFRCSQDILKITYCQVCEKIHGFKEYNFLDQNELDIYFGFKPKAHVLSCQITTHIVEYVNGYSELEMEFSIRHIFKVKFDRFLNEIMNGLKNEIGTFYNDMSKKFDMPANEHELKEKLKEAERLFSKGFITRMEYDSIRESLTRKKK